jgi:hypothetical protein
VDQARAMPLKSLLDFFFQISALKEIQITDRVRLG